MEFRRREKKRAIKVEHGSYSTLYPHDLQLYKMPPVGDMTVIEFEQIAMDRLKVLRALEYVNLKGLSKSSEEYKAALLEELKKTELKSFIRVITSKGKEADYEARRMDHISHFILRLAYCRSEILRRWFIAREMELFRFRWSCLSEQQQAAFLEINNLEYKPITDSEREQLQASGIILEDKVYYRVEFLQVLDLVRTRHTFLHNGFAYIKSNEIISCLMSIYRNMLSHELMITAKELPSIEKDDRISLVLNDIENTNSGDEFGFVNSSEKIDIKTLDSLSKQSFPLCMRQLHNTLRSLHHLKHGARLQYGLFLKGIGVTLEDALTFWREEFLKKIDLEKFEKQYSYSIRHSFGKEGKRVSYTPYSCMKIITSTVSPGEHHGCPFKHNDVGALRSLLQQANVTPAGTQEICELTTKGHYQIACAKYFEIMHGVVLENGINHPNQYFEDSQRILKSKTDVKPKPATGIPTSIKEEQRPSKEDDYWGDSSVFESIDLC